MSGVMRQQVSEVRIDCDTNSKQRGDETFHYLDAVLYSVNMNTQVVHCLGMAAEH